MSDAVYNPGLIKLDLMLKGVRLDASVYQHARILQDYRLGPDCLGNCDFILPGQVYVSAPYQESFVKDSPYLVVHDKKRFFLECPSGRVPLKWIDPPQYYDRALSTGVKLGEVISAHGGYVSLALGGHRYLQAGLCAQNSGPEYQKRHLSVDEVLAAFDMISRERWIDVVTLSAWDHHDADGGILQIEPYIRAIKKNYNVLLLVEVHLPQNVSTIDQTYAMGADSVCYHIGNLCSHGPAMPARQRQTEIDIKKLKHAVTDYPPGTVLAHITAGAVAFDDLKTDIASLCAIKVLPILTLESLALSHKLGFTAEKLADLFAYVYDQAKLNKIKMNWFSRLAPFISPIEGRYFTGDMPHVKLAWMNFYQSRFFGNNLMASLSNLRRKLRVRE